MVMYDFSGEDMNPWAPETWSLTEQGKFLKRMSAKYGSDFGLKRAQAFAARAGSKVGATRPVTAPVQNRIYILKGRQGPPGPQGPMGGAGAVHEFLGFFGAGLFNSDQYFTLASAQATVTFPTRIPPDKSKAICGTAPTSDATFYLVRDVASYFGDGSTVIATATFLAGQTNGAVSYNGTNTVTLDSVLFVICPHVADQTIQDVEITFCGDPV